MNPARRFTLGKMSKLAAMMALNRRKPMRALSTNAALLGLGILAAAAASSVSYAQQSGKMKRIGMINSLISLETWRTVPGTAALLSELHNLGYEEGQNFTIEYRWTEGGKKSL